MGRLKHLAKYHNGDEVSSECAVVSVHADHSRMLNTHTACSMFHNVRVVERRDGTFKEGACNIIVWPKIT